MRGTRLFALILAVLAVFAMAGCDLLPGGGGDGGTDDGGSSSDGDVRVELAWDDEVDMDLEIWDNQGENALFAASSYAGTDVTDGSGTEFFEFKQYGDEDFGSGKYVVSVFYAGQPEDGDIPSVPVTLTITKPDGSTETRSGTVFWEAGQDQWHAFRIDAATGAVEDIDELVEITVE
jgi:hypothetical protein